MKYLFLFIFIFLLNISLNAEDTFKSWRISKKMISFTYLKGKSIYLSNNCIEIDDNFKINVSMNCKASNHIQLASLNKINRADLQGGKNPGAVMCTKLLGGNVVFGYDITRNQKSFCKFDDNSYVDTIGLIHYGRNDDQ